MYVPRYYANLTHWLISEETFARRDAISVIRDGEWADSTTVSMNWQVH